MWCTDPLAILLFGLNSEGSSETSAEGADGVAGGDENWYVEEVRLCRSLCHIDCRSLCLSVEISRWIYLCVFQEPRRIGWVSLGGREAKMVPGMDPDY